MFLLTGLLMGGCAGPHQAMLPARPLPGMLTHRVGPHDTLWSLSKTYGVPYREIMRANGLTDPTQVPVGRVLVIPRPLVPKARIPLSPNPRWTHIVVHHSATERGNAKLLDRSHRKRGFTNGLGYHFVIDNGTLARRDGQIEVGPRWLRQREGAHCNAAGMNEHGIGICLIGDFTRHAPSAAQTESLVYLVEQLQAYYRIPRHRVIRHRDVPGKRTICPGDDFPWAEFQSRLSEATP